jgi:hypothetical protein
MGVKASDGHLRGVLSGSGETVLDAGHILAVRFDFRALDQRVRNSKKEMPPAGEKEPKECVSV